MRHALTVGLLGAASLLGGCESGAPANKPLDQSKIISVRPAIPDGARAFVEQQKRLEQQQQKKSAWGRKQPAQPVGYGYTYAPPTPARPTFGQRMAEFFSFKKKQAPKNAETPAQPQNPVPQSPPAQPVTPQPTGQQQ